MNYLKALRFLEQKLQNKIYAFILIAAVGLIAYSNSFSVPFILDDYGSIVNNYAIHKLFDFAALWSFYANRIVLYFSLSINYFLHGSSVEGYHITNLVIHLLNALLLFLILKCILGLPYFKGKPLSRYKTIISLVCAILFVCHPMQINAVTYIIQRTASLACTFYFLAILFFLKYRIYDKIIYFILVFIFTILAMFTKENTITIPFMLLFLELFFFMNDGKTSWKKRLVLFTILFLTIPIIPATNLLLHGYSQSDPRVTFKASTSMDRMQYFYTELNVILLYIRLMFFPDKQNFDYSNDFPMSKTIMENYSYMSFAVLLVILIFALLNIKRNRLISLGIVMFFTGLAVESSFISIKDVYFEQRLYFSCAGFIMFIVGVIFFQRKSQDLLYKRFFSRKRIIIFLIVGLILTVVYTGLTYKRNFIYGDPVRLWSDVVAKAPKSDRAHSALGASFLNEYSDKKKNTGVLDLAESELKKSIELNYYNSTAHANLSKTYLLKKQFRLCIDEAYRTLNISKTEFAYYNMGMAYKEMGQIKKALDAFLKGYYINKRRSFILNALGDTYYELKDYKNSKYFYQEYLKYSNPKNKFILDKIDKIASLIN